MNPIGAKRLLIVAEPAFLRQTVGPALRRTAGFHVLGFLDGRREVRAHLRRLAPDVVLLDDMQRPEEALERLREIAEGVPAAKVVLVSNDTRAAWHQQALEEGAQAVVARSVDPGALGTLVREIASGTVIQRFQAREAAPVVPADCPLTEREREILGLVAEGMTNAGIARKLWVTEQTVKFHLSNTYRKLGVANRTEASRYAHVHGLAQRARPTLAAAA